MKRLFLSLLLLAGCSDLDLGELPGLPQPAPTVPSLPTSTPSPVPSPQVPALPTFTPTPKPTSAPIVTVGDCKWIKFDGAKPLFLLVRSSTGVAPWKVLLPGAYGRGQSVKINGEDAKFCGFANPDTVNGKLIDRAHWCWAGKSLPARINVDSCPTLSVPAGCASRGRCD